ncbi:hypothetical protein FKP32DRAFT_1584237 [Trametes sanguinea]|nr:hypothetical protein FKP32DRAFT_1584237 [Trametes sanguinea]
MIPLRAFLSRRNLDDDSQRFTIDEIRYLYFLWKRQGRLHFLGPQTLSSLIRLLGSLSLSHHDKPYSSIWGHPRLADMPQDSFDSHWELLMEICRDKQLYYPLCTSDLYWLMRARIARFWEYNEARNDDATKVWLAAAKDCYDNICDSTSHPDVHVPYLKALLTTPSPEHTHEFMMHIRAIFTQSRGLHPWIRDLLFESMLSTHSPQSHSRIELLATIAERFADNRAGDPAGNVQSTEETSADSDSDLPQSLPVDARGLVMALDSAVFYRKAMHPPSDAVAAQVHAWSSTVARRVFSAASDGEAHLELRWSCLVLLALIRTRSPQWRGQSADAVRDPLRRAASLEWQTVCVLAAIENMVGDTHVSANDSLAPQVVEGFSGVLRKLWHDWTSIPLPDAPPRPLYVSRLICASFLKLAGYLQDKSLIEVCRGHSVVAGLWWYEESDPSSAAGLSELAVEQLYAALLSGTFFERALVDLVVCTTDMALLRQAIDSAVLRTTRINPEHAHELVAWATHRGITPSGKVIAHVGVALARRGDSSYLERYMTHPSLDVRQRTFVVIYHLWVYARLGRQFMSSTAFMSVVPDVILLSTQLAYPEVLIRSLWKAFLVLLQEGYGLRAVSFALELAALHPSAIPASYYTDLLLALLRHREVKIAHDLLEHCSSLHPDMAPSWKELVTYQSARQGASRLATNLARTGGIGNRLRWQAASISRSAGHTKGAIFLSFRLWEQYDKTSSPSVASSALQLFIRLQRIAATWRLYERICRQESREVRTSTGNIILHGTLHRAGLRRSPARRARTVVSIFKTLVERHDFTPDRVTLNILLKALLLSKTFNARQVRTLFDALVRLGYPSGVASVEGDHAAPARMGVFGTPALQRPSIAGLELSSFTTTPMLYMRHVRPLYKTFTKAFYLLGDVRAAMTVIGIKKALETGNMSRLAKGLDWYVSEDGVDGGRADGEEEDCADGEEGRADSGEGGQT